MLRRQEGEEQDQARRSSRQECEEPLEEDHSHERGRDAAGSGPGEDEWPAHPCSGEAEEQTARVQVSVFVCLLVCRG